MRPINKLVIFDCLLSMCFLKVPSLDEAKGFVVVNFVKSAFIHGDMLLGGPIIKIYCLGHP